MIYYAGIRLIKSNADGYFYAHTQPFSIKSQLEIVVIQGMNS